jgi:hypothetical protein
LYVAVLAVFTEINTIYVNTVLRERTIFEY